MNAASRIDVSRLIRIATLLFAILAASLVYFAYAAQVDALQQRLADDESILRSDEVAFATIPRVRAERDQLARRYATLFGQNAQAMFLRDLSATTRRHGLTLVSTTILRDSSTAQSASDDPADRFFHRTHVDLEWRGPYARLLAAVDDLSRGSVLVRVDAPSLAREGESLVGRVPLTLFEPIATVVNRSGTAATSP